MLNLSIVYRVFATIHNWILCANQLLCDRKEYVGKWPAEVWGRWGFGRQEFCLRKSAAFQGFFWKKKMDIWLREEFPGILTRAPLAQLEGTPSPALQSHFVNPFPYSKNTNTEQKLNKQLKKILITTLETFYEKLFFKKNTINSNVQI